MKLKTGICGVCDECKIGYLSSTNFVPNDMYREFYMLLSDGTVATHGVCSNCIMGLTNEKVVKLFNRIKDTWDEEMYSWGATMGAIDRMKGKKVVGWSLDPNNVKINVIKVFSKI